MEQSFTFHTQGIQEAGKELAHSKMLSMLAVHCSVLPAVDTKERGVDGHWRGIPTTGPGVDEHTCPFSVRLRACCGAEWQCDPIGAKTLRPSPQHLGTAGP